MTSAPGALQLLGLLLGLLLGPLPPPARAEERTPRTEDCFLICVAKCLSRSRKTDKCWTRCKDLLTSEELEASKAFFSAPYNLSAVYNRELFVDIGWSTEEDVDVFVLQFKRHSADKYERSDQIIVDQNSLANFSMKDTDVCEALDFRVASVSSHSGLGLFSEPATIQPPEPALSALTHVSSTYRPPQPDTRERFPNGTLEIVLAYEANNWPLGDDDLVVNINFHNVRCTKPDFYGSDNPEFYKGARPRTLVSVTTADYMFRDCVFSYGIQKVTSSQCKKTFNFDTTFNIMNINCSNVLNSNCAVEERNRGPVCGQVEDFKFAVVAPERVDWSDAEAPLTVNVSFRPMASIRRDVLYYVALYGEAVRYENADQTTHMGVNLTTELGRASSCRVLEGKGRERGQCTDSTGNSILLSGLHMDTLYGVTICGVRDVRNLDFPRLNGRKSVKPRADMLLVQSALFRASRLWLYVLGFAALAAAAIAAFVYYVCRKERRWKIEKKKLELSHSASNSDQRYTDLPKVQDVWELHRRNLVIHSDKQLGRGAFGAVFLGRLIGQAKGSKDAQSTLGVNLMRAENCQVAVKMLPEYADELSKQEFLREIGLMKTLGYHERLVNMLACITDSEPYCLVVEYCSDGDLLHFLRDRCQYLLQLEEGAEPEPDMALGLKQLLMFAVQISFGLEYLSQKGFVHRDVAARNVLVHDRSSAKIGDFGLCRFIYAEGAQYKSKGGRLPLKWMSPEAIRQYEFTTKSDVWSFGVLMFEIVTLGGCPYPGVPPEDMLDWLESGKRMEQPDNCPDEYYEVMQRCWAESAAERPSFSEVRLQLARQLEATSDEYSYLRLDAAKDYYRLSYEDGGPPRVEGLSQ